MAATHDAAVQLAAAAAAAHSADLDVWLNVHRMHATRTPVTVTRHNDRTSRGQIVRINGAGFELDSGTRIPWPTAAAVAPASTPLSSGAEVIETPEDARAAIARLLGDPATPADTVDEFLVAHGHRLREHRAEHGA